MSLIQNKAEVYQWDSGLVMQVPSADITYVDYQLSDGTAERIAVSNGEVQIPDAILEYPGTRVFWLSRDDQTREQHSFTVHPRPIPPDYASTPAQRITFDDLVDSVNDKLDEVDDAIEAAENVNISVSNITGGHRITITDNEGNTRTVDVMNGAKGDPGTDGEDGTSPKAVVEQTSTGAILYVTDEDGTTTATISNGQKGDPGDPGQPGQPGSPGQPGENGVSPTVSFSPITGGIRLTITDATGEHSADIMNGSDASATDVRINGTSITEDGVANIPIASENTAGIIIPTISRGFAVNSQNKMFLVKAVQSNISNRDTEFKPIVPTMLDYAVKAAMTDGIGPAWSSTEQAAARQRIGIDKEWVLKGTITDGTGVSLDLTGCTELIMYGTITTSATTNMTFNGSRVMFVGISNNNTRTILAKVESNYFGFSANAKTTGGTNQADIGTNLPGHDWRGFFINSITSIGFNAPANVTSCTIQIYAR